MTTTDSKTAKTYIVEAQRKILINNNDRDDKNRVGLYVLDFYDEYSDVDSNASD